MKLNISFRGLILAVLIFSSAAWALESQIANHVDNEDLQVVVLTNALRVNPAFYRVPEPYMSASIPAYLNEAESAKARSFSKQLLACNIGGTATNGACDHSNYPSESKSSLGGTGGFWDMLSESKYTHYVTGHRSIMLTASSTIAVGSVFVKDPIWYRQHLVVRNITGSSVYNDRFTGIVTANVFSQYASPSEDRLLGANFYDYYGNTPRAVRAFVGDKCINLKLRNGQMSNGFYGNFYNIPQTTIDKYNGCVPVMFQAIANNGSVSRFPESGTLLVGGSSQYLPPSMSSCGGTTSAQEMSVPACQDEDLVDASPVAAAYSQVRMLQNSFYQAGAKEVVYNFGINYYYNSANSHLEPTHARAIIDGKCYPLRWDANAGVATKGTFNGAYFGRGGALSIFFEIRQKNGNILRYPESGVYSAGDLNTFKVKPSLITFAPAAHKVSNCGADVGLLEMPTKSIEFLPTNEVAPPVGGGGGSTTPPVPPPTAQSSYVIKISQSPTISQNGKKVIYNYFVSCYKDGVTVAGCKIKFSLTKKSGLSLKRFSNKTVTTKKDKETKSPGFNFDLAGDSGSHYEFNIVEKFGPKGDANVEVEKLENLDIRI